MKPRRVNVDRMRRHRRGPHSAPWLLDWVRGVYPGTRLTGAFPLTDDERAELRRVQRWAGITVDGELGPQSWVLLHSMNTSGRRRP